MRITVFTSNQPRHTALIERLASIATEVYAVQECSTVFPGKVQDFFRKSDVMQAYFARVIAAEADVFGRPRFLPANVRSMPVKMADVNQLDLASFGPALQSDAYVVFGASFLKGPICEHLVARRAVNIHMGVSPYYRGSSTNFWAMYDRRPQYVGATIHLLTSGLDSGPMLFHAFPKRGEYDPFVYGMHAVRVAQDAVVEQLRTGELFRHDPVTQDRSRELRYTRNADFTDAVAADYLARLPAPVELRDALVARDASQFLRPYSG